MLKRKKVEFEEKEKKRAWFVMGTGVQEIGLLSFRNAVCISILGEGSWCKMMGLTMV